MNLNNIIKKISILSIFFIIGVCVGIVAMAFINEPISEDIWIAGELNGHNLRKIESLSDIHIEIEGKWSSYDLYMDDHKELKLAPIEPQPLVPQESLELIPVNQMDFTKYDVNQTRNIFFKSEDFRNIVQMYDELYILDMSPLFLHNVNIGDNMDSMASIAIMAEINETRVMYFIHINLCKEQILRISPPIANIEEQFYQNEYPHIEFWHDFNNEYWDKDYEYYFNNVYWSGEFWHGFNNDKKFELETYDDGEYDSEKYDDGKYDGEEYSYEKYDDRYNDEDNDESYDEEYDDGNYDSE